MRNFFYILIIIFVAVSLFIVKDDIFELIKVIRNPESGLQITEMADSYLEIKPEIQSAEPQIKKIAPSTPGAIKIIKPEAVTAVDLNPDKIVELTNTERARVGLKPLILSIKLTSSARAKTSDMLSKQYFEHTGPDGRNVSDWIEAENYAYAAIGENLAMGDFSSETDLVQAWMNSPGHRENILNAHFTEIGAGVLKGFFEGRQIWISTQHFGRPLSDCPEVDQALKDEIDAKRVSLDNLSGDLELKKAKNDIEEYNSLIKIYNDLVQQVKTGIDIYNQSVRAFNACVANQSL